MGLQDEVKSLIVIGGLPMLSCFVGFLLAFIIFPNDGFRGMILTSLVVFFATLCSVYLMALRLIAILQKKEKDVTRTYIDMEWPR